MIRTEIDCQAGVDALKESYIQLSLSGEAAGILAEWFAKSYLKTDYFAKLASGVDDKWTKDNNGENVNASIAKALEEGIGQPLLDLINYLDNEHKSHCLPNDLASGLANLPVDFVFINGTPDKNQPTNKTLPTGERLNGTESYKLILSYFTTTDISPEEIFDEGKKQLKIFYDQVGSVPVNFFKQESCRPSEGSPRPNLTFIFHLSSQEAFLVGSLTRDPSLICNTR